VKAQELIRELREFFDSAPPPTFMLAVQAMIDVLGEARLSRLTRFRDADYSVSAPQPHIIFMWCADHDEDCVQAFYLDLDYDGNTRHFGFGHSTGWLPWEDAAEGVLSALDKFLIYFPSTQK
jgi:hypothetical protein